MCNAPLALLKKGKTVGFGSTAQHHHTTSAYRFGITFLLTLQKIA